MPEDGDNKSNASAGESALDGDGDVSWKELAAKALVEKDPAKLAELCKQLNEVMLAEERKKVEQRLGHETIKE